MSVKNGVSVKWSILIAIAMVLPMLISSDYYLIVFCQVLLNIVAVIGLNFISGLTGQTMLGMAGVVALGAYISGILSTAARLSPWLSLLGAIIMGILIGQILGWPSLRVKGIYLALTTIGFSEVVKIVINNLEVTGGALGLRDIPPFSILGYSFSDVRSCYYLYLLLLIISMFLSLRIINSRWGRAFRAIKDNEDAVEACGVDIVQAKLVAFTLCSVFGCVAGSMYAHLMGYLSPSTYTFEYSAKFLMMLMVGGLGSPVGLILGGVIVTALPELLRSFGDYYWLIFTGTLLLLSIFCPYGIVGISERLYRYFWNFMDKQKKKRRRIS